MRSFYDTTSSVYPDEFDSKLFNGKNKSLEQDDKSSFEDDVYRPYITPPTPFEATTKEKLEMNPYSQSLWYTSGNDYNHEVSKYAKANFNYQKGINQSSTDCCGTSGESDISDVDGDKYYFMEKYKLEMHSKTETPETVSELSIEPDKTKPLDLIFENFENKLLPSLMKKTDMDIKPILKNSIRKVDISGRDQITSQIGTIDTLDNELLKPLNDPPSYELISRQSKFVKKLKILHGISIAFNKYVKENSILLNSKVKMVLFSNIKTLLIIHQNFLHNILFKEANNKIDTEQIIYDHLQRLIHIYPSYIRSIPLKDHFISLISSNSKFQSFVINIIHELKKIDDQDYTEFEGFKKIMISPYVEFRNILEYLDEYIGVSSPRIRDLIEKILNEYEDPNTRNLFSFALYEPLFLEIPESWKFKHNLNWKEISRIPFNKQIGYYLRFEVKKIYHIYYKLLKDIGLQIEQLSQISIVNKQISTAFINVHDKLPGNNLEYKKKYVKRLEAVDEQNKYIVMIIESFTKEAIANKNTVELKETIEKVLKVSKKLVSNINSKNLIYNHRNTDSDSNDSFDIISSDTNENDEITTEYLFKLNAFKIMIQECVIVLFSQYFQLLRAYYAVMRNNNCITPSVDDVKQIVNDFQIGKQLQVKNTQQSELQYKLYNQELSQKCAKNRLMKRFFD